MANSTPTLEEKIAKMLIIGVDGTGFNENSRVVKDIVDYKVGGVIFFERNIIPVEKNANSIEALGQFAEKLQSLREDKLIIAIDQEGGRVTRLKEKYGFPKFVSAKYLGDMNNPDSTRYYSELTSQWLNELNINTNFTPCVDLIVNENCPVIAKLDRAYSDDAVKVTSHAEEVIKTSAKYKIYTSLKHFPGHGSSTSDSHDGFTDISETWSREELVPFQKLIDGGSTNMVMVGHLFNNKFDATYPATLSKKIVTGLLREEMGWNGVVITDDMLMGAIIKNYTFEKSVEMAINAGCDLFIYSGNVPKTNRPITEMFITTVKKLIAEGKVSETLINDSYMRIQKMCESY